MQILKALFWAPGFPYKNKFYINYFPDCVIARGQRSSLQKHCETVRSAELGNDPIFLFMGGLSPINEWSLSIPWEGRRIWQGVQVVGDPPDHMVFGGNRLVVANRTKMGDYRNWLQIRGILSILQGLEGGGGKDQVNFMAKKQNPPIPSPLPPSPQAIDSHRSLFKKNSPWM